MMGGGVPLEGPGPLHEGQELRGGQGIPAADQPSLPSGLPAGAAEIEQHGGAWLKQQKCTVPPFWGLQVWTKVWAGLGLPEAPPGPRSGRQQVHKQKRVPSRQDQGTSLPLSGSRVTSSRGVCGVQYISLLLP